jgi:LysR family glycine cleavage system transcriptional activator
MVPRFPSLSSIRAFEAAARTGGFAPAARELETTAAAVSYHVRQLEAQIGAPLFRRLPQRVELTPAGEAVAAETIAAFAMLRASFVRAADIDRTQLRVTALPTLGTSWLTPRLGRFRALHPGLRVDLDLSADARDLAAEGFDVAMKLFPSVFTPLCAPGVLEAARGLEDPRWSGLPLLGRPDWWAAWYRDLDREPGPSAERFGTRLSAEHLDIAAAIAGHGIAIGSPILFEAELTAGRLVQAHPHVAADGRAFWIVYPAVRGLTSKVEAFRDWLLSEVGA